MHKHQLDSHADAVPTQKKGLEDRHPLDFCYSSSFGLHGTVNVCALSEMPRTCVLGFVCRCFFISNSATC